MPSRLFLKTYKTLNKERIKKKLLNKHWRAFVQFSIGLKDLEVIFWSSSRHSIFSVKLSYIQVSAGCNQLWRDCNARYCHHVQILGWIADNMDTVTIICSQYQARNVWDLDLYTFGPPLGFYEHWKILDLHVWVSSTILHYFLYKPRRMTFNLDTQSTEQWYGR